MGDKWKLYKGTWDVSTDDEPTTDASDAEDSVVESAILENLESYKKVTDMLVALSVARFKDDELLRKLREAVTIAYSYILDNRTGDAKKELEKVVNL